MANFFIIRNKEKNMYYWGDGSWTKSKDCAKKYQHKDCAEILIQIDRLDYKICEVIEIPSIADLEAKLAESEKKREEIDFAFDMETDASKMEKEFFVKQIKSFQEENNQLKQQLAEKEQEYKFKLKEMDNEYKKEFKTFEEDCKHLYKTETKKAIEELTRVKEWLEPKYFDKEQINYLAKAIDQQINNLRSK